MAISKKDKIAVLKKYGNKCVFCNNTTILVDYLIPIRSGGCDCIHNYIAICEDCSVGKGQTVVEYLPDHILDKLIKPRSLRSRLNG
jgi:hypothetical protein